MLDNEIDRLDRAVKTFLNFTGRWTSAGRNRSARLLDEVLDAARPSISHAGLDLSAEQTCGPSTAAGRPATHSPGDPEPSAERLRFHDSTAQLPSICVAPAISPPSKYKTPEKESLPKTRRKFFSFFTTRPGGTGSAWRTHFDLYNCTMDR